MLVNSIAQHRPNIYLQARSPWCYSKEPQSPTLLFPEAKTSCIDAEITCISANYYRFWSADVAPDQLLDRRHNDCREKKVATRSESEHSSDASNVESCTRL